jgi:DNA-binding NarL/FixJ family response regulator
MIKTLIVDDYRLNRETLKGLFIRYFPSMILEEASNGQEAVKKLESFKPDLIMMDIRLPDGSGMELTKKIKETNHDVKVLILTGHHYPEYQERATLYGADGFLVKGESGKEIVAAVESLFPKAEKSTFPGK